VAMWGWPNKKKVWLGTTVVTMGGTVMPRQGHLDQSRRRESQYYRWRGVAGCDDRGARVGWAVAVGEYADEERGECIRIQN
jgi:hypothetical protein